MMSLLFSAADKFTLRSVIYAVLVSAVGFFAAGIGWLLGRGDIISNRHFVGDAVVAAAAAALMLCLLECFLYRYRRHNKRSSRVRDTAEVFAEKCNVMLSAVLQAIPDLVFIKDLKGRHISVNQAAEEFTGLSACQLLGKTGEEILPPGLAAIFAVNDRQVMLTKKPCRTVERFKTAGGWRALDTIKAPIYDQCGNFSGIVGISRDITARFQEEEERAVLQTQLHHAQKMEALGHFAAGIAHDFNNILTVIVGYTHFLNGDLKKGALEKIADASARASSLVQSLFDFSRRHQIDLKPTNMNDIVRNMETALTPLIAKDVDLRVHLTGEELTVMADQVQLGRVLENLATNARDAMPGGGQLVFQTDRFELDDGFIQTHGFGAKGGYARLRVADTGVGIPDDILKKVFEPFFTTKQGWGGTGLGLSIVYGIVKQHKGYVTVSSEQDRGSTFHILLPLMNHPDRMIS